MSIRSMPLNAMPPTPQQVADAHWSLNRASRDVFVSKAGASPDRHYRDMADPWDLQEFVLEHHPEVFDEFLKLLSMKKKFA